ncbi:MAG: HDOD domain-containing protein [Opitutales bacterium]
MDLFVFDPAGESGTLFKPFRALALEGSAWSVECFDHEPDVLAAVEANPQATVAVDAEEEDCTPELLQTLTQSFPGTVRVACASTEEIRRLKDLCGRANQFCFRPLDPERIGARLQQAQALRGLLCDPKTLTVVTGLRTLPAFLDSYGELLEALDSPDAELEAIGAAIERDVALCSTILSLANSAFFGRATPATTAMDAVSSLGLSAIRAVVMAYPALSLMDHSPKLQKRRAEFWSHAQAVAEAARIIARAEGLKGEAAGYAYSGGLLHDVGKLILGSNYGGKYDAFLEYAQDNNEPLHSVEQSSLGTDHGAVGAFMLAVWGVPTPIVESIWHHHEDLTQADGSLSVAAVVSGANQVAHLLETEQEANKASSLQIAEWVEYVREARAQTAAS